MSQAIQLKGFDVALAIRLLKPASTLEVLAEELGMVASQVHASIKRLAVAGLVLPGTRKANRSALREFIEHGVRYAFPAQVGKQARGIPTAHSAPLLAGQIDAMDAFVWPASDGDARVIGLTVVPLYPKAPLLASSSPDTYAILALVDVFRVGRARERALALPALEGLLYAASNAA